MPEPLKELPSSLYDQFLGPKEKRVAVLGAFDTWPYMHKICTDVVRNGFTAVTSRYVYRQSNKTESGYFRAQRDTDNLDMNSFLKENVIGPCSSAIIVYSVPGAHYNEADWCNSLNVRTLGVAFVRTLYGENYCEDCVLDDVSKFSYCQGEGNAWGCLSKKACPFKEQGIAKSQLEYYLMKDKRMSLIAVEKIERTTDVVARFLNDNLQMPSKLTYVFECRLDIPKEKQQQLSKKIQNYLEKNEDSFNTQYEYIDHYYKPKELSVEEWLEKKRSVRIRQFINPIRQNVDVCYTEAEQTPSGFYCKDPFGRIIWYQGDINRSKKLLDDIGMDYFLRVIKKEGQFVHIQGNFKAYLEEIEVEDLEKGLLNYGWSLEIELWTDKPRSKEEIEQKKSEIITTLGLEDCRQQIEPVQEFVYRWADKQ